MTRHTEIQNELTAPIGRAMFTASCLALCLVSTALAACSSDAPVDPVDGAAGADGASAIDAAGAVPDAFVGPIGGDRPVSVYVPASYQDGTATPLVVLLHGYTASGTLQDYYFDFESLAEERGFLYAYPDGLVDQAGQHYWNATDACCDHWDVGPDDSSYLRSVINGIKAVYSVDPKQVYLVGHSNGGFMSHRMACEHADTIAAIVSLAGAQWADIARCQPSEPVAVLQVHGSADLTILYNGGELFGTPYPGAEQTVEDWRVLNGCADVSSLGADLNLDAVIIGDETAVTRYNTGCQPGGHAELWRIGLGGHIPIFTDDFGPAVIDFLYAHPKP